MKNRTNIISEAVGPHCGIDSDFVTEHIINKLRDASYRIFSKHQFEIARDSGLDPFVDSETLVTAEHTIPDRSVGELQS
jgi:hypothetical protein